MWLLVAASGGWWLLACQPREACLESVSCSRERSLRQGVGGLKRVDGCVFTLLAAFAVLPASPASSL